jgi:hypothetical protein
MNILIQLLLFLDNEFQPKSSFSCRVCIFNKATNVSSLTMFAKYTKQFLRLAGLFNFCVPCSYIVQNSTNEDELFIFDKVKNTNLKIASAKFRKWICVYLISGNIQIFDISCIKNLTLEYNHVK